MDLSEGSQKISNIVSSLSEELSKIRTGRATPDMLDDVVVEVYESEMPIKHIASISVPDARTINIQPWDSSNVEPIEKAILKSDLGLTPIVDGELIRISIPPLTQELREKQVKEMKERVEECKVAIRGIRHKMLDYIDQSADGGGISEDDVNRQKDEVEKEIEERMGEVDKLEEEKEKELMTV